jgi:hypothetical protein
MAAQSPATGKMMPTTIHAATYSSTMHYLRAVRDASTDATCAVGEEWLNYELLANCARRLPVSSDLRDAS